MKTLKDQFYLVISICLCFIRNLLLDNCVKIEQTVNSVINPLSACVKSGYVSGNKRVNVDTLLISGKGNGNRTNFTMCSYPHFRSP